MYCQHGRPNTTDCINSPFGQHRTFLSTVNLKTTSIHQKVKFIIYSPMPVLYHLSDHLSIVLIYFLHLPFVANLGTKSPNKHAKVVIISLFWQT